MRYGFFSDVHANEEALRAAIKDFESEKLDKLFFLGDAVGYGPSPNECVSLIDEITDIKIMGNHDYAALGLIETDLFNHFAQESIEWTMAQLNDRSREIMSGFVLDYRFRLFHLVHSTPREPQNWHYLLDLDEAEDNFPYFSKQVCLIGHSHRPAIIKKYQDRHCFLTEEEETVSEIGFKYIINIGSIGQPRDGTSKACYLIYDTKDKLARLRRVEYDVKETQAKMRKMKLPQYLIDRLSMGR
ncbi:MAG: metallophosphatase family protein [candidate division Zixibacteria bacterium]|nr:metallophosphatase family protein [candidate division Zixibacteria bacterium]